MPGDVEDALTDFPDPLAHRSQTNADARLFELLAAGRVRGARTYVSAVGNRRFGYFFLA